MDKLMFSVFLGLFSLSSEARALPFTVDSSTMYVTGGKVGIGTTSPSASLHINTPALNNPNPFQIGTSTFVVQSGGNIGIGTANPQSILSVSGAGTTLPLLHFYNSNTTNNRYSEFRSQYQPTDSSYSSGIRFLKEATGANYGSSIGFLTELDQASQNYNYRMYIKNGMVGIGTTNPSFGLDVSGSNFNLSNGFCTVFGGLASDAYCGNSSSHILQFYTNNSERVRIDGGGNVGIGTASPAYMLDVSSAAHATSFTSSSDVRFKENIKPLDHVLEKLGHVRGVSFDWNARYKKMGRATQGRQIGVIAQEVEKEFPELVTKWSAPDHQFNPRNKGDVDPEKATWEHDYRSMDYGRFTAVLLEAIKEQQKEIDELKAEIKTLMGK